MLEFPESISNLTAFFLIFASMATSFITSAFGIGGGAVLLGLLAVKLPPVALLPIHGIVQIGSNLGRTMIFFKDIGQKNHDLFQRYRLEDTLFCSPLSAPRRKRWFKQAYTGHVCQSPSRTNLSGCQSTPFHLIDRKRKSMRIPSWDLILMKLDRYLQRKVPKVRTQFTNKVSAYCLNRKIYINST